MQIASNRSRGRGRVEAGGMMRTRAAHNNQNGGKRSHIPKTAEFDFSNGHSPISTETKYYVKSRIMNYSKKNYETRFDRDDCL